MNSLFDQRLQIFAEPQANSSLRDIKRGIEKESLRITPTGKLAQTAHPVELGSALTNPYITTDFSEALLEFITPPFASSTNTLDFLDAIHRFTYQHIGDEILWGASMPCILEEDKDIPIAQFGSSNVARMKTAYRMGLANRYGRSMQTIAGIHYNFSLPDSFWLALQHSEADSAALPEFKTAAYFGLTRSFHRLAWLLLYLYGAAPALCKSFLHGKPHQLQQLGNGTLYQPYATSLRMGDLGYTSAAQQSLVVSYNSLHDYASRLHQGLTQAYPEYAAIPVVDADGNYQQLNDHLLQIENEYYSSVRPKRTTHRGETPIKALLERGVEYVEVRAVDINPFLPLGIDATQMYFMDVFLLYCTLEDSPQFQDSDYIRNKANLHAVIDAGRDPQLRLTTADGPRGLRDWARAALEKMAPVAALLDQANNCSHHQAALAAQLAKVDDAELTPSAIVLRQLHERKQSFFNLGMEQSLAHREYFKARSAGATVSEQLKQAAKQSLAKQQEIELEDGIDFAAYLHSYFQQYHELGL